MEAIGTGQVALVAADTLAGQAADTLAEQAVDTLVLEVVVNILVELVNHTSSFSLEVQHLEEQAELFVRMGLPFDFLLFFRY